MPLLKLEHIRCAYGDQPVIDDLSFHVNQGELVSLLGSSGCGKTTALRAIAGFEPILAGRMEIDGHEVARPGFSVVPERRPLGMVFQDYALFPHLTVAENLGFGLRKESHARRRQLVEQLLLSVGLGELAGRYPHELSGGQQQRLALARALAPRPRLLLLDEPFSNLDVELRERLSNEVRDLLKQQGITAVLVTHDQHEAFAVSDKIGVMHGGRLLQWDTPYNLYHEPAERFVADFIGQGRFISGRALSPDSFETEIGVLRGNRAYSVLTDSSVDILIRPDDLVPDPDGPIQTQVVDKAFRGAETLYTLQLASGTTLLALFASHNDYPLSSQIRVRVAADHLISFPGES